MTDKKKIFAQSIKIPAATADALIKALTKQPADESEFFSDTIIFKTEFPNGRYMSIGVYSTVDYEEDGENRPYTVAELHDPDNRLLAKSDESDELFKEWAVMYENSEYVVRVEKST